MRDQAPSVQADPDSGSASAVPGTGTGSSASAIILVRHGETEWSRTGRHTGRSDVALTAAGEEQARAVGSVINSLLGGAGSPFVISSPRQRALDTAALSGFEPDDITEQAAEWDYGTLEGLTSTEIGQQLPGWSIWTGPVPGGEDAAAMTTRIDGLLSRIVALRTELPDRPVVVFSHGHASRCIAARWLGQPVSGGRHYWLGTGAVSSLGFERARPVILRWNIDGTVMARPG